MLPPMPEHCPTPPHTAPWQDTVLHRLTLAVLISRFESRLLAGSSATLTMEGWLRDTHITDSLPLRVEHVATDCPPPCPPPLRAALNIPADPQSVPLRYRKIHLVADGRIFSKAENWYRPDLLTSFMQAQLETTSIPFGHVVQPLGFSRRLVTRETLWSPLPDGWPHTQVIPAGPEGTPLAMPEHIFRHAATLHTGSGTAFSAVVETYTPQTLGLPPA